MYLKAVEAHGFKSFGEKVYIEFNEGITSIVGPNGSGKSNILDAVLWVLGEQSYKNIRAKESQDVIFSGGKDKKPMNHAEVSLVIDNSDQFFVDYPEEELTITRKIHITGENEYFINRQKSRLKDISALFLDTGIGKSAYSVIGQGKVERIINSSPKEVKGIIEEAAGIKKFQASKQEASKNLEHVETELEKLELLLQEIREQKNRVEKQAEVAQNYLNVQGEKQRVQKSIFLTEQAQKESEKESFLKEQEEFLAKQESLEAALKKKEEALKILEQEKEELQAKMEEISSQNDQLRKLIHDQETEKARVQERQTAYKRELDEKKESLAREREKKEQREQERKTFVQEKQHLEKQIADLEEKNKTFELLLAELETEKRDLDESIEVKEQKLREVELQKLSIVNDLENSSKRMQSSETRIKSLQGDVEEQKKKKQEMEEALEGSKKKALEEANKIEELEKRNLFMEEEISRCSIEMNKVSEAMRRLEFDEKRLASRYEAICRMDENNEGFFKGVKEILQENMEGVEGVFLSLVQIPEHLEVALEAAVASNFQDIVVKENTVAKKAIALLQERKAGKASFLPLDLLKVHKKTWEKRVEGVLGLAVDLVSCRPEHQKAIDFVLGNLLVVDNYDIAVKISKNNEFSGNIVTLQGQYISSRGRISGGEQQKSSASQILERKRERKQVEADLEKLREQLTRGEKKSAELSKQVEDYENELLDLESKIDLILKEKKNAEDSQFSQEAKLSQISKHLHLLELELEEELRYTREFEKKMNTTEEEKEKLVALSETLKQESQELREKNKALYENLEKQKSNFSDVRILFLNSKNQWEQQRKEEEKRRQEEEELQALEKNLFDRIEQIQEESENLEEQKTKLLQNIESALEKYHKETKELEVLHQREKDNTEQTKEHQKEQKELESQVFYAKDRLQKITEKLDRMSEELESLVLELEALEEAEGEVFPFEKLKSRKESLRNLEAKLLAFGAVNLLAIEEFRALKEKYEYLGGQRDDLVRGKKVLLDLIQEIKDTISERFQEAYESIRENFNQMCMETLDNSEGKLQMIEAEEFENAGVEISVKFKNKKRQSLSLLSGGEKSMVAIAFIMSIFMYKPSPFTFLDEIEAALDEKNTKKLLAKLRQFTTESQFILITHNKDTMRESDSIFGVTMNKEIGISKIVPVKL